MKKIFSVFVLFIVLIIIANPIESFAESFGSESEISRQIDEIMSDYDIEFSYEDIENLSFLGLLDIVKNSLTARIYAPLKVLKTLVLVILFTAVMKNAG